MLRDYQLDLLKKLFEAYKSGFKAPCVVLPCGGGKSVITAEIARRVTAKGKTVLFLVHRKELCEQIEDTFTRWGVDMSLCRIMMVQTMTRRLGKYSAPDFIITDENHHSRTRTYRRIYDYFPDVPRVGVTATPKRTDGKGLKDVNDILIEGVTAKWLIENQYLSPYRYFAPGIIMPKFHVRHGDFDAKEVNRFFEDNITTIYGDAVKHYRRLVDGKQAICYLPGVEVSRSIAEKFTADGIVAAHIDGKTPKAERSAIIEKFRRGEIKILCNVDIISEGFDVPDCECAILLRPTKSLILYIQQSMRCMRYKEGKTAIIIDHVNNVRLHGFPDAEREWSLEDEEKPKGEVPVKTCPECFACVPIQVEKCPHCGFAFEIEKKEHITVVDRDYILKEITALKEERVSHYLTPGECVSVEELQIYARQHGYKPGWVWYQQKNRGWLNNEQRRNSNTKRYPCRAV